MPPSETPAADAEVFETPDMAGADFVGVVKGGSTAKDASADIEATPADAAKARAAFANKKHTTFGQSTLENLGHEVERRGGVLRIYSVEVPQN